MPATNLVAYAPRQAGWVAFRDTYNDRHRMLTRMHLMDSGSFTLCGTHMYIVEGWHVPVKADLPHCKRCEAIAKARGIEVPS